MGRDGHAEHLDQVAYRKRVRYADNSQRSLNVLTTVRHEGSPLHTTEDGPLTKLCEVSRQGIVRSEQELSGPFVT